MNLDIIVARIVVTIIWVLTLSTFTIDSADAQLRLTGWPMVLTRWWKNRRGPYIRRIRKKAEGSNH